MRLPWKREAVFTQPRPVSTKALELVAAVEILAEVFRVRPAEVEEMIQQRLEERNCSDGCGDGLWPAMF